MLMIKKYIKGFLSILVHLAAIAPLVYYCQLDFQSKLLVGVLYFVLFGFILHVIESVFYFEENKIGSRQLLQGVVLFVVVGILSALIPSIALTDEISLFAAIQQNYLDKPFTVFMPLIYSTISFMVIYSVIGSLTWPFVKEYYTGEKSNFSLKVPSGKVVIGLQLLRGFLATLVIALIFNGLGDSVGLLRIYIYLTLSLCVTFSIMPMVSAPEEWPLKLRLIHGVEICVFVALQSFAWWYFLSS